MDVARAKIMAKLDEYMTIKDAAEYLGVSINTLRNWANEDKFPVHRNPINNYRLIKIVDLDQLMEEVESSAVNKRKKKAK